MNMVDLRDSHAYQLILEEGEAKGKAEGKAEGKVEGKAEGRLESLHETLLRLGKKKFGKPSAKVLRELKAITDERQLARLSERILEVDSWQDLLASK